ncbi:MAG: DUF2156 domain-containing protein [Deltaproteobacteria bacterium]
MDFRPTLHPLFKGLKEGISEFTFANIYLFRENHNYQISRLGEDLFLITGIDQGSPFFMLPFGFPKNGLMDELFLKFISMKCVSESQVPELTGMGHIVTEDRDNFDYLYLREDLVSLPGAKLHKKRTLINAFVDNYSYEGTPLTEERKEDALNILEKWREERGLGDYSAAREALEKADELQLCGGIYYVNGQPAAYTLGEEITGGEAFVIHFEKAIGKYKGLYQFVNQSFATILPMKYRTINREQDLGDEGLKQAKMTYRPVGFVKKYRARKG